MSKIEFINCELTINKIIVDIAESRAGIYLRFGDGDFNLAQNKDDMLAKSNMQLSRDMLNSMSIRDNRVMICIPHHAKELKTVEKLMCPGYHEYDMKFVNHCLSVLHFSNPLMPQKIYTNIALSYCAVETPEVVTKLHAAIKQHKVIFIGNYKYSEEFLLKLFGNNLIRIFTNDNNAYQQKNKILKELDIIMNEHIKNEYFVIIMAAGCASRAFSGTIYKQYFISKPNFYIFDYGSLLDYLYGFVSREYLKIHPPDRNYILNNI